ncbi:MAG: UPF0104 family protein, partial [Caldilineae bacterium]
MFRRGLFWLLVAAFLWIFISHLNEIEALVETLASGVWGWVLVATLFLILYYVLYTAVYQSAFGLIGIPERVRDLLPVMLASLFVNVAAPTGGASGAALFVDNAARKGHSPARAAVGGLLALVSYYAAFGVILLAGLGYLFVEDDLRLYQVVGSALLMLLTAGMGVLILLGLWLPNQLRGLLAWFQRWVNGLARRFHRPAPLADGWAEEHAAEFAHASEAVIARPGGLVRTLGVAMAAHGASLVGLYLLFLAFHQPVTPGALVAGYTMGFVFWIVSPVPQGIGVVEGVMTLVYTSLGVPSATATVVSLAFRGLVFWLPLAMGFVVLHRVDSFKAATTPEEARGGGKTRLMAAAAALTGGANLLSNLKLPLAEKVALFQQFILRLTGSLNLPVLPKLPLLERFAPLSNGLARLPEQVAVVSRFAAQAAEGGKVFLSPWVG